MISIKVKFRASSLEDGEGSIFYQLTKDQTVRQFTTGYKVFPYEWDEKRSLVICRYESPRMPLLVAIRERIRCDVERLVKIDRKLCQSGAEYEVDALIDEFRRYAQEYSLFNYMEDIIARLKQNGKTRTAETYRAALLSFRRFRHDKDILLESITPEIMENFESWQKRRGNVPNTISFYARILRAVYNRAVEADIIEDRHPFRHVYTGIDKTVKRALSIDYIKRIKLLNLKKSPSLDFARDMFMISFYLRGMSFIDMAFLRKSDLCNGYISYRRRKTGQRLIIKWTAEMQRILDKYPENNSDYLLPVIRNTGINERYAFRNVGYNINHNLKAIGSLIGLAGPLTLYVARHSWASVARSKGIPLDIIAEGMGHTSISTTRIYLSNLDTSLVDRANSLVLQSLT